MMFVTALFDIRSMEQSKVRRSMDDFCRYGQALLNLNIDLTIFLEKKIRSRIEAVSKRGSGIRNFVEIEFDQLPDYANLGRIEKSRADGRLSNWNTEKDTPFFTIVQWSKIKFIEMAMNKYPKHTHFTWIDFGINHVVDLRQNLIDNMIKFDKVRICELRPTFEEELSDDFFTLVQGRTGGGLILFPRNNFIKVHQLWEEAKNGFLDRNLSPLEDEIFTYLRVKNPDCFSSYFGGYPDLLRNFNGNLYSSLGHINLAIIWAKMFGKVGYLKIFFEQIRNNVENINCSKTEIVEVLLTLQNYINRNKRKIN